MKIQRIKKKAEPIARRDGTILAAFRGEIDLKTKVEADKSKYNRKKKHKNTKSNTQEES
jgi:hypothetical protein